MWTLGLVGDTMLGRKVAERLAVDPPDALFSDEVVAAARQADVLVANLECCISDRGERWPDPRKPFFFRAPPVSTEALQLLGTTAVTLANNHALDFGDDALSDTFAHLDAAGIAHVGAGPDVAAAREPTVLEAPEARVAVVGLTDHPADFAAAPDSPGAAYADLDGGVPGWVGEAAGRDDADVVLVTPHWGPNMTTRPVPHVRRAADELVGAGAHLVAGHSAHVFHGVGRIGETPVLFDLGDFIDDYAVDPVRRNDLGLLWLVHFDATRPVGLEAVPLFLDYCHTRLADEAEAAVIGASFSERCADLGTTVEQQDGRFVVQFS
ncbi:MAG: CapA family protein [Nitriliruptorales bacterium]